MVELVIDTLQYADRLEEAGVGREQASAMARALEEQLGERMPTRAEINERFNLVDARFDRMEARLEAMDAKFEAKFEAIDHKFEAIGYQFEGIRHQFEAVDGRFKAIDARFEAIDGRLRLVTGVMIFGFTLLTALGLFQSVRSVWPGSVGVTEVQQPAPVSPIPIATPDATRTTVPTP